MSLFTGFQRPLPRTDKAVPSQTFALPASPDAEALSTAWPGSPQHCGLHPNGASLYSGLPWVRFSASSTKKAEWARRPRPSTWPPASLSRASRFSWWTAIPRQTASSGIGFQRDDNRRSIYDVLMGDAPADQVILPTEIDQLCLLPGSKNLTGANIELATAEDRALRLRRALAPIKSDYDLVILDCPPALDLLTLNVLAAADTLIVPMQAEYFALEGISELISTLERVRAAYNPTLTIEGVLLTMYDDRTNLAQQVTETLREYFKDRLYHTVIPRNVRLAEAPSHGKPVALYDPRSRGTEAYFEMAGEFMARNGIETRAKRAQSRSIWRAVGRGERSCLTPGSRRDWL